VKTEEEVKKILKLIDAESNPFPGMTYIQGIEEALLWVVEDIEDEDFSQCFRGKNESAN
jgi:hypothetical protein